MDGDENMNHYNRKIVKVVIQKLVFMCEPSFSPNILPVEIM